MRFVALVAVCLLSALPVRAAEAAFARATVPAMKTSIYVGSVTLTVGTFERAGDRWTTTYNAKVFPWFPWSEHGDITITVTDADLARLAKGETVEFTGDAQNHKKKPRKVTGRAQPANERSGKIKVRIHVDDVELIFNGTYELTR
ncbi:MAG: hypothetical protein HYV96_04945 [Opitutae bacterium]|nr:hypothetical protein [Opitutae bacterium]